MTNKQIETLIKKLESCKTTKSANTILNKKGIETVEEFGKSYSFDINGEHYNVVKHKYDETCHVNHFEKRSLNCDGTRVVPMCFGKMVRI